MNFYKSHTSQWTFPLQEPRELELSDSHIVILWLQSLGEPLLRLYGHTHKPVHVDWAPVHRFNNSSDTKWLWFRLGLQNRKVKFTLSIILAVDHIQSKNSLGPNHLFIAWCLTPKDNDAICMSNNQRAALILYVDAQISGWSLWTPSQFKHTLLEVHKMLVHMGPVFGHFSNTKYRSQFCRMAGSSYN